MSLAPGGRLGPYEVLALLGAGGMGEVYKARDPRLNRIVALKVLAAAVADDPGRLRRFEHETRVLSGLNHPHIVTVHEVGHDDSTTYMAMEFVEGRTLQSMLLLGPLPFKKLTEVAAQMAIGLAAAHKAGIVHRDVKPSNVMVSSDGFVKIVDFGLAKSAPVDVGSEVSTASASEQGRLVGTAAYMSPEQARGQTVDSRSDQFSLGIVLYEMATGIRPFQRGSSADTISAILSHEPPTLTELRPNLPAPLRWVVERCLSKDPEDRFGCTQDLASVLAGIRDLVDHAPAAPVPSAQPWRWVAAVTSLALLFVFLWRPFPWRAATVATPTVRFDIYAPPQAAFNFDSSAPGPPALSPDGREIVFGARDAQGKSLLWVRPLDGFDARPLPGTEGGTYPFWAPDSRFIAFFVDGKIKKCGSTGGPIQTLGDAPSGRGGTWNEEGVIVFAPDDEGPLHRISAAGGASTPLTRLAPGQPSLSHRWPHFLPDGQRFLYCVSGGVPRPTTEVHVGSLQRSETRLLLANASNAAYAVPGRLLFVRDGALMAMPLDLSSLEVSGEPIPVADSVHRHRHRRYATFTASNLVLAYQPAAMPATSRLAWSDRAGQVLGSPGGLGDFGGIRLSPDGQRCAMEVRDVRTGTIDIWILDLTRGIASRLTSGGEINDSPTWAPDGGSVLYTSNRKGHWDLYRRALASGVEEPVWESAEDKIPTDWSADDRIILFNQGTSQSRNGFDIWFLSRETGQASPFLATPFNEREGRLSPDGRWVAYASDESGVFEVYVSAFPQRGSKRQVSASGGTQPIWRRDGKELLYLAADNRLMAVPAQLGGGLEVGAPKELFDSRLATSSSDIPLFDVSADGTRFLLSVRQEEGLSAPLRVIVNWTAGLKP